MNWSQCSNSVTHIQWQVPGADNFQMIVAGYISHPRWLNVLLFPDRIGNNTCQVNRQSDENITIYFPIIIITSSQAGTWLIQYRRISFVWTYFKPRNIMTAANIPINHLLDFIRSGNNRFIPYISKETDTLFQPPPIHLPFFFPPFPHSFFFFSLI